MACDCCQFSMVNWNGHHEPCVMLTIKMYLMPIMCNFIPDDIEEEGKFSSVVYINKCFSPVSGLQPICLDLICMRKHDNVIMSLLWL